MAMCIFTSMRILLCLFILCGCYVARDKAEMSKSDIDNSQSCESNVTIPIIDISILLSKDSSQQEKLKVADEIANACEKVGFFVIIGHGISDSLIDSVWKSTSNFFDLPTEYKQSYERSQKEYPFGYTRLGGEILSASKIAEKRKLNSMSTNETLDIFHPDMKEMFSLGPDDPKAGFPPRIFPDEPRDFQTTWVEYYNNMAKLAAKILSAFALGLQLDEDYFERFVDHHGSALRALNYPHIDAENPLLPGQLRASAHSDYGTITILKTDYPGLQVSKDRSDPSWIDVPYVEDAFIINLGDLMARWTGDMWVSTLHRVINPDLSKIPDDQRKRLDSQSSRRQSIAFFYNINPDAVVETLPSELRKKVYDPIVAGEFLLMKHMAAIGVK